MAASSARIVAVANQKGGVAKTTTVVSLGAALAEQGRRVLLVDLDAQACLTFSLGVDPDDVEQGLHEVLRGEAGVGDVLIRVPVDAEHHLDLVPATIDLAAAETELAGREHRELVLREALAPLRRRYDVMLLDCSPSLGLVTLAALAAADEVIVPVQCEMLSHRGVGQLLDTVADVQRLANPGLIVRGLLPTMFDGRTTHAREVLADLEERYGVPVLTPIPRSVRFAEAPATGRSVLVTATGSRGAQAYRDAAKTLAGQWISTSARPRTARVRATTRTAPGPA